MITLQQFQKNEIIIRENDLDEAIDNFESGDKDHQLLKTYNHMICFYLNKIKLEKIRKILKKSERISHKIRDEYLIFRVNLIKDYVKCFNNDSDMDALNDHLNHVNTNDCFAEDWLILSECYKHSGDIDKSKEILEMITFTKEDGKEIILIEVGENIEVKITR